MKIKLLFLAFALFFAGCKDSASSPDCSTVLCAYFRISLNVRYVDKDTNTSLLNAGNSNYQLADLKIVRGADSDFNIETKISEKDNSVIVLNGVVNGDLITLGNLAPDKFAVTTQASKTECCSVDITSLKINDITICAPCTDLNERVLVIKK